MTHDQGQARWQAIWRTRGPWAWALRPVALLYGGLSGLRRWLYSIGLLKVIHLPVPVVVVGNVVVGGAGKTPTVLALVQHLQSQGWNPGVVSRGYGRQGTNALEVHPNTPSQMSGDEPALIRRQSGVPVFVAPQRVEAARALLAAHPAVDLIVCDDGLQHLALGRDLAIAVFDDRGIGNGWLLPAGFLREPWPPGSLAKFAPDLILLQSSSCASVPATDTSNLPTFAAQRCLSAEAVNGVGHRASLKTLAQAQLTAIAGIARPASFFSMLRDQGLLLAQTVSLPDHAGAEAYTELLQDHRGLVLCTEKDAVKLFDAVAGAAPSDLDRIWAVPLVLRTEPAFFAAVDAHLARVKSPTSHP
jgi:tetraacyldisaccharide 4'-kinase